jgi:hypothetical protein
MTPAVSTPKTSDSSPMTEGSRPAPRPCGPIGHDQSQDQDTNLAGAYLNQFKEIVELIERLPSASELMGDLLNWRPTSYNDYFSAAAMPGRPSAADVYASLNRFSQKSFEGVAGDLDCKALGAAAALRRHYKTHGEARPDIMMQICDRAGKNLREALGKANSLASHEPGTSANAFSGRRFQINQA